jgi:intracellular sulfur oxidation DsrE/DsrF family protein
MFRVSTVRVAVLQSMMAYILQTSSVAVARTEGEPGREIMVDIPVKLDNANVVFNMDHLATRGDMPVGLRYMDLMEKRFQENGTKGQIIAVFHGDAAHFTLNDKAYNAARNVKSGNPYKELIGDLIQRGVQIEECAVSMKNNGWGNDDLLPGVKVNAAAVSRIVQLSQQGFVQIQP